MFALDDPSPNRIRFELERVMRTHYRIDDFQETYFVLPQSRRSAGARRVSISARCMIGSARCPTIDPGDVLPTDAVITRGTGRYHRDKRNGH